VSHHRTAPPSSSLVASGVALIAVTYGLARYAYALYLPDFRDAFGLSASLAGAIAAAGYATYAVSVVLSAVLTTRWGARATAVLAGVTATVGLAAIAAASGPVTLAVGAIVAGASAGLASPPLVDLVARGNRPGTVDREQSIVNSGTGVGVLVSAPSVLLAVGSWRVTWALFAVTAAAVTVAVARVTRTTPAVPALAAGDPEPTEPLSLSSADRRARASGTRWLLLASFALGVASAAVWTFGRDILTTVGQLSSGTTSLFWVVLGAASILGASAGALVNRWNIAGTWAALSGLLAVSTASFAALPGSAGVALVSGVMFGGSYVAATGILIVWATRIDVRRAARLVAAAFLFLSLGQVVGVGSIGLVIDHVGWFSGFLVSAVSATAAAGLATRAEHGSAPDTRQPCRASTGPARVRAGRLR